MAFSISSVSPEDILSDGGREVVVSGSFEAGASYNVHIGDLGTTDDPGCHSGIAGQGYAVYPYASTTGGSLDRIKAYSPRMNPDASAYDVVVINTSTLEAHLLSGIITAQKKQYFTTVYAVRRLFPPDYKTGPRNIDLEEPT